VYRNTPLIEFEPRHGESACRTWLKMECWQPTGSFKIRGMSRLAERAAANGAERLVCSSGGNAGLAVAWAGRALGLAVTVVVPDTTGEAVRERLTALDAELRVHGAVWNEADALARDLSEDEGAVYMPPFDHPLIWSGHSTMIDECVEAGLRPGGVVVAVGGGGLLCGVLEGLRRAGWNDVPVHAVETEGAASLHAAMENGGPVDIGAIRSLAKTLGALEVCERAWEWTREHDVRSVLVSDADAVRACRSFADDHRALVEPACGAALSVVYDGRIEAGDLLVVVCGGSGVSLADLDGWGRDLGLVAEDR